jgi:small subunit ribosomal protein S21
LGQANIDRDGEDIDQPRPHDLLGETRTALMFSFDRKAGQPNLPAHFPRPNPNQPALPMPEVQVKKGEPVDRALKRLKTKLESEGILEEVRRLRAFETPKERLRRKARAAAKRGKIRFRFSLKPVAGEKAAAAEGAAAAPSA